MSQPRVGILTGPTASGKTSAAIRLCESLPQIEIINADSIQVYRELNIGSAKPSASELKAVPHHLINIRNPDETFTAGDFVREVNHCIEEIHQRGKRALIVGGTGFYLKALVFGLWGEKEGPLKADPEFRKSLEQHGNDELYLKLLRLDHDFAEKVSKNDRYRLIRALEVIHTSGKKPSELEKERPQVSNPLFEMWLIDREKEELNQRIAARTQEMVKEGLVQETQTLLKKYPESRPLRSVGYAQVQDFLSGIQPEGRKIPKGEEGLVQEIDLATRQLVKRQRTWFRGQTHESVSNFVLEEDFEKLENEFLALYGGQP